ncbi:hypothetical protein N481_05595 [Pseudoalteromonas luteoviolacea S4047-1]|nr:hypothetical protein N481_05595 [Pseudoalteromonas luteoviolacea S4047-1]
MVFITVNTACNNTRKLTDNKPKKNRAMFNINVIKAPMIGAPTIAVSQSSISHK